MTKTSAKSRDVFEGGVDERTLLLSPHDNIVVALKDLEAGVTLWFGEGGCVLDRPAPTGFKIARRDIARGEKILKYGAEIGSAVADIEAGQVVHIHNMKSDYLPTYTHDGRNFTKRDGR